uniref:Uncharacterized protein n=1 Tax=viral metagenome TaxID=1070528 RepID=A0A6C0DQQ4_9ZZZZ
MSLFIHKENQELLWNIINKTPQFVAAFKNSHPSVATNWFRSIIQSYYYDNNIQSIQNITSTILNTLNRNVLSYMISTLTPQHPISNRGSTGFSQQPAQQFSQTITTVATQKQEPTQNNISFMETNYSRMQSKEDNYSNQFEMRQKEYETMFAKPKPPIEPKLSDNIKDDVITNMEELIERHRKQREDEIKIVQSPIYPTQGQVQAQAQGQVQNDKVVIKEITNLAPEHFIEVKSNKSVSWKDESYSNLEQELVLLKKQMAEIIVKNKEFEEKFDKWMGSQQLNVSI